MILGGLALPGTARAGQANGRSEIVVLRNLSFIKIDDLEFGAMIPGGAASTVTVAPGGGRTTTGPVTLVGSASQPAQFGGRGAANQNLLLSINANSITLTRAGGTQTMIVDTFTVSSTPVTNLTTVPTLYRISSSTGIFQFGLGARLRVGANQAPGNYTGTFRLTLIYQ
jgi:hypothetical protein